jgi:integrating conjugative element protein (TIGR03765 family)
VTVTTRLLGSTLLAASILSAVAAEPRLIVVQDIGGTSALPYYRALHLLPSDANSTSSTPSPGNPQPVPPPDDSADALPVHSARLTPGRVTHRIIAAPGLSPIFLIGDDVASRAWLQQHLATLRALYATGFVVNVDTPQALESLRTSAAGLTLRAAAGDDLAQRLGLEHYPVLITSTVIEQ